MITRLLESNGVVQHRVDSIKLQKIEGNSLIFETSINIRKGTLNDSFNGFEDLSEAFKEYSKLKESPGALRIDVITDRIIRIRYKEAEKVNNNENPMVIGTFEGPSKLKIKKGSKQFLITTGQIIFSINLKPFRIEIFTLNNVKLCGLSGLEKNNFNNWDAFGTGFCYSKKDNSPIGVEKFDLHPHEAIYGFGEQFTRLNKVGQTIDLIMKEALGTTTPRSYKNTPFFVSTKGYGVFFNHSCPMTVWVGSMSATDVQVAVEDDFLDYYVILGNIKEILSQYTDITGKGVVPPKWTFGYWQSKISYKSAEETLKIAKKLRENEIPCDVIHLDTHWFKKDWYCDLELDKQRFPDPKKFFEELTKMGFKVSLWQLPYIPEGSKYYEELKSVGGFVKTKEGEIYDTGICMVQGFKGVSACIDFTNPNAVEVYQKWIGKLLKLGAKVIKTDFGESAPLDGVYYNGTPGHRMHNLYPLLYNKAACQITKEMTGGICMWSRSAWAGNQRYPVHWGGDSSANWTNMIPQLEGGLSFGLSGYQFWSQDIGGFAGLTFGKLLIRWMQLGLFHSHSRIHGMGKRELYRFRPNIMRICRDYIQLRYQLLPYIYGSAFDCVEKSLPMTRALVIEFQDDPNVWNISNEFMFGDNLLVAPITDDTNTREIYFPKGVWTDWWNGERIKGEKWINVEVDIETLPLYIREGGIIPIGPVMNYIDEIETDEIELRIGKFEGDGKSTFMVPVKDDRIMVEYVASNGKHKIKVGKTDVNFIINMG
ncbi:MAG: glycoside hydrolase family 31 protein [Promethearchaeota archaeon]|nr:MAG: glycoside hydrolase family 31 protein [Candidatus Lokiarchaeota archaeon]